MKQHRALETLHTNREFNGTFEAKSESLQFSLREILQVPLDSTRNLMPAQSAWQLKSLNFPCANALNVWRNKIYGSFASRLSFRFHSLPDAKMEINKNSCCSSTIPENHQQIFTPLSAKPSKFIFRKRLRRRQRMRPEIEAKLLKIGCHCVGCFPIDQQAESYFRAGTEARKMEKRRKKGSSRNLNKLNVSSIILTQAEFIPFLK